MAYDLENDTCERGKVGGIRNTSLTGSHSAVIGMVFLRTMTSRSLSLAATALPSVNSPEVVESEGRFGRYWTSLFPFGSTREFTFNVVASGEIVSVQCWWLSVGLFQKAGPVNAYTLNASYPTWP